MTPGRRGFWAAQAQLGIKGQKRKESNRSETSSRNINYTPAKEMANLDSSPLTP